MVDKFPPYFKYLILAVFPTIVVFFIIFWIFTGRTTLFHTSYHKRLYTNEISLYGAAKITQTIQSKYPGLHRVDIYFYNRGNQKKGAVIFRLKESCDASTDLRTISIQQSEIVGNEFHPFVFEPLDSSVNRQYCIVLETENLSEADEIGIFTSLIDVYPAGEAVFEKDTALENIDEAQDHSSVSLMLRIWLPIILNQTDINQYQSDIGFQLYYKGQIVDTIAALLTQLTAQKPFLLGRVWFYILLFGFYFAMIIVLWLTVFKARSNSID
jgi:hypothetical protein